MNDFPAIPGQAPRSKAVQLKQYGDADGLEVVEIPLMERPFAAVVIIEMDVSDEWRDYVSRWLVQSGCLYMMAWGNECSFWDDCVDRALLQAFDFGDIPDDEFILTTWHDDEPLEEAFFVLSACRASCCH